VIHGQLDYRVPLNHGIELFNILQNRGVRSRFVYYPDEKLAGPDHRHRRGAAVHGAGDRHRRSAPARALHRDRGRRGHRADRRVALQRIRADRRIRGHPLPIVQQHGMGGLLMATMMAG
jgi:hypothetical protein